MWRFVRLIRDTLWYHPDSVCFRSWRLCDSPPRRLTTESWSLSHGLRLPSSQRWFSNTPAELAWFETIYEEFGCFEVQRLQATWPPRRQPNTDSACIELNCRIRWNGVKALRTVCNHWWNRSVMLWCSWTRTPWVEPFFQKKTSCPTWLDQERYCCQQPHAPSPANDVERRPLVEAIKITIVQQINGVLFEWQQNCTGE